MTGRADIEIGGWYQDSDGERFEVVAVDEDSIEIQYFNGDLEALEWETWLEVRAKAIPAPEDWSGPFDDLVEDDFGDTERPRHPEDWGGPLERIEADSEAEWED